MYCEICHLMIVSMSVLTLRWQNAASWSTHAGGGGDSRTITWATKGSCSACRRGMPKISPAWLELASSDRASPTAAFASEALAKRIVAATRTLADEADVRLSETCEA